mgnify:CR=1 FL=1
MILCANRNACYSRDKGSALTGRNQGDALADGGRDQRKAEVGEAEGRIETLHRLLKLNNRLMAPFSTHLAHRYNISLNEFRLLMAIGRLGASASHELAQHTGVNAMSVSRAVATLQRHGRITELVELGYSRDSRAFPEMLTAAAATGLANKGVRYFLSRYPPPGSVRVGGAASPAVGVYELPEMVAAERPRNTPPEGLTSGVVLSIAALLVAVALIGLLPYHTL